MLSISGTKLWGYRVFSVCSGDRIKSPNMLRGHLNAPPWGHPPVHYPVHPTPSLLPESRAEVAEICIAAKPRPSRVIPGSSSRGALTQKVARRSGRPHGQVTRKGNPLRGSVPSIRSEVDSAGASHKRSAMKGLPIADDTGPICVLLGFTT
jgi:hypothetical protein